MMGGRTFRFVLHCVLGVVWSVGFSGFLLVVLWDDSMRTSFLFWVGCMVWLIVMVDSLVLW